MLTHMLQKGDNFKWIIIYLYYFKYTIIYVERKKINNELFNRIKAGEKAAFEVLFNDYFQKLCAFVYKYVNDLDASKDIVHDIFLILWQNREKIEVKSSLKAYLFKAVQHNAIKYLNRKKLQDNLRHNPFFNDVIDGKNQIEDPYLMRIIYDAIEALPEKCKEIIYYRLNGFKNDEIAANMNIKKHTVENQLNKAREVLKKSIKF